MVRSHHSQHHPLPPTIPAIIKGKQVEPSPNQQLPIDVTMTTSDTTNNLVTSEKKRTGGVNATNADESTSSSRSVRFIRRLNDRIKARIKSYYMYYSLNNLFDWIIYTLCSITTITHFIDVGSHTVVRARIHMYIASVTVILLWFRFMVFFRTISISARTLRSKLVEIKLGELVIMVSVRKIGNKTDYF
jgi:hypothetical protein